MGSTRRCESRWRGLVLPGLTRRIPDHDSSLRRHSSHSHELSHAAWEAHGQGRHSLQKCPNGKGLYYVSKDELLVLGHASGAGGVPACGHGLLAQTIVPSFLGHVSKGPRARVNTILNAQCVRFTYWAYIFSYNQYKLKQLMLKNRIFSE